MYDSRSDHPHRGVHWPRSWREMGEGDRIEWGTPRSRVLATPAHERLTIAEGLAEYEADLEAHAIDGDGLKRLGRGRFAEQNRARRLAREREQAYQEFHKIERARARRRTNRQEAIRMTTTTRSTRQDLHLAVLADVRPETPATIRRPVIAKRAFSRLSAERFDPSKVSRTLSPHAAG